MKLSLIASLICLAMVGCASAPLPQVAKVAPTIRQLPPPPVKSEAVEVAVLVPEEEVKEQYSPADYARLSDLIHREVTGNKCMCVDGDPFCRCKLKSLSKMPASMP